MKYVFLLLLPISTLLGEENLAVPSRSVAIPVDFSQQPIPRFRNGFLVAIDSTRTRVRIWDRDAALKIDAPISVPDTGQIVINDVAVAVDGSFAVTATLSGASSAIVWCTPSGTIRRVTTTSPFSARRIAFHANGELWAAGWVKNDPEGSVVRVYAATGDLRRTAMPSANASQFIRDLFLAVRSDRVGVISFSAGKWFELDLDGRIVTTTSLPTGPRFATGAAVVTNGYLYASFQDDASRTLISRLDSHSTAWVPTGLSALISDPVRQGSSILGAEGHSLVIRTKPPNALQWVRVE